MNSRGSVAMMTAICMIVLIGFAGLAIDLERLWALKSRLQTSLDAAALLAAREITSSTMQTDATALFWANFLPGYGGTGSQPAGIFGSTSATLSFAVSSDNSTVTITATALLPLTPFIRILPGIPVTLPVSDQASATPGASGLEVALVLDNTGSMAQTDGSTNGTKLQALQAAIADLMNILYGPSNDTVANLWVSVVPFVTTINVGNGTMQQGWLSSMPTAAQYKDGGSTQYSWAGCVQGRWTNNDDESDAPPSTKAFVPYFADDTYNQYGTTGHNQWCTGPYSNGVCMGDNDWGAPSSVKTSSNPAITAGLTFGPNRGCPVPILPLTASKNIILTMVNGFTTAYSGTIIGLGMQGGWFTLSPNWRGSAGWGDSVLPHNYMTQSPAPSPPIQKVAILVSDGDNTWGYDSQIAPGNQQNNPATLYMPYGRLSATNNPLNISESGGVATTLSNANAMLDTRWQAVCTNMKNAGITVFVIGLGVSDTNARNQLTNCATTPSDYLESPTASSLSSAFTQIGSQISNLRLTQ